MYKKVKNMMLIDGKKLIDIVQTKRFIGLDVLDIIDIVYAMPKFYYPVVMSAEVKPMYGLNAEQMRKVHQHCQNADIARQTKEVAFEMKVHMLSRLPTEEFYEKVEWEAIAVDVLSKINYSVAYNDVIGKCILDYLYEHGDELELVSSKS